MIIKAPSQRAWIPVRTVLGWFRASRVLQVGVLAGVAGGTFVLGAVLYRDGHLHVVRDILRANRNVPVNYLKALRSEPPHLFLDIDHIRFQRLAWNRALALDRGMLLDDLRDEVPATITVGDQKTRVRVRLKGDLPDHWDEESKWSLRVHVRGEGAILGMRRFSIQHPKVRSYLNGWFFHRFLRHLGLVGIRYHFVRVTINGKDDGIYALEEHRQKEMVAFNRNLDGPLFRAETQVYWNGRAGLAQPLFGVALDSYESGRVETDPLLGEQYARAKALFEAFRTGEIPASQVFDVEKFATLLAVLDLTGHRHAGALDNIVFYFNPATSRIEPIAGDNNRIVPAVGLEGAPREFHLPTPDKIHVPGPFHRWLIRDPVLFRRYVAAVERLSAPAVLDAFFREVQPEYREQLRILHREWPWYDWSETKARLYQNQAFVRAYLNPSHAFHAYFVDYAPTTRTLTLELALIHGFPSEILGVSFPGDQLAPPRKDTVLEVASPTRPLGYRKVRFGLPPGSSFSEALIPDLRVRYRIPGARAVHEDTINPGPHADPRFSTDVLMDRAPNIESFPFLEVDAESEQILIRPGSWTIDRELIVPAGRPLVAGPGTELILEGEARVLSHAPLDFQGSPEQPVVIRTQGATGQGLTVMKAGDKSVLRYVRFVSLGSAEQDGSGLPGAVTFYESPLDASHVELVESRSEVGLHLIRGSFHLEESFFGLAQGDAVAVDFADGEIWNSRFVRCGSVCLRATGARVELRQLSIDGAGLVGILARDGSILRSNGSNIRGAPVAVVSRDASRVELYETEIADGHFAVATYQTKPEFGPGAVVGTGLEVSGIEEPYLIEEGSRMVLDRRLHPANRRNVGVLIQGLQNDRPGP